MSARAAWLALALGNVLGVSLGVTPGARAAGAQPPPAPAPNAARHPEVDAARGAPLLARVVGAPDGTVRLTYALRPEVCGTGNGVRTRSGSSSETRTYVGEGTVWQTRSRDVEWEERCEAGPGRLVLDVSRGEVTQVRLHVGGRWRAPEAGRQVTDLGAAGAPAVAAMLLAVAERADGRAARSAIFPASVADSVAVWPALLRLARDARRPAETRKQAAFWLAQAAGDAATRGLTELTDDPDREVRVQALYALSRRPADEGVPALVRIARTHRDPELRRQAMYWLGRSEDPRALALFEELLGR